MQARHFAHVLLLCVALSGCSGSAGKEPESSDSPPPTAQEIAYFDCLGKQGVKIEYTDYGAPREAKSQTPDPAAYQACASLTPPPRKPEPATPERLAAVRAESTCLRAEGISWYPDPDPVTAQIDDSAFTAEQVNELKVTRREALMKCHARN
ncbi:hypothetical protein ACIRP0_04070 [Streptomyces sp. NPDC101733]|uniref:hypothetical protein n=1 Tax=unclassified Streptomyces TaxID=2593676 RepID=UPI003827326D